MPSNTFTESKADPSALVFGQRNVKKRNTGQFWKSRDQRLLERKSVKNHLFLWANHGVGRGKDIEYLRTLRNTHIAVITTPVRDRRTNRKGITPKWMNS